MQGPMTLSEVQALDHRDPLREVRGRFVLPPGLLYFDGHSLGAMPSAAADRLGELLRHEWGERLIRSWNESGWIDAPQRVGAKIARLIGAKPNEVLVADSTSVNLFKLLIAAARLSDRPVLLSEAGNFHTDVYVASGVAELTSLRLDLVVRSEIERSIGPDTNLLLLTHVHYKTAERFDMKSITARARESGALTIWDLSHSAGAVPLALNRNGAELAVGCGYKYLNGGPGAPAFLYIAEHLQEQLVSPMRGWMGHAEPFAFCDHYVPAPGIDRFLAGTPPILSLAALECGLDGFDDVSIDALWEKSVSLFDLFAGLMAERCLELVCISPIDEVQRGSHISFRHAHAFEVCQALIEAKLIGDFREPDIIRFGLTPLYQSHEDVWNAVERCADVIDKSRWHQQRFSARGKVT